VADDLQRLAPERSPEALERQCLRAGIARAELLHEALLLLLFRRCIHRARIQCNRCATATSSRGGSDRRACTSVESRRATKRAVRCTTLKRNTCLAQARPPSRYAPRSTSRRNATPRTLATLE